MRAMQDLVQALILFTDEDWMGATVLAEAVLFNEDGSWDEESIAALALEGFEVVKTPDQPYMGYIKTMGGSVVLA